MALHPGFIPGVSKKTGIPGQFITPGNISRFNANPGDFSIGEIPDLLGELGGSLELQGKTRRPRTSGTPGIPSAPGTSLIDQAEAFSFSNLFDAPGGRSDEFFGDLLANVQGPSTVDELQGRIETDALSQLLEDIERDTQSQLGEFGIDIEGRGVGGPGQLSELESAGRAGILSRGGRSKAQARTQGLLAEIQREKAREEAERGALSRRFETGVGQDIASQDIAARGALSQSQLFGGLLGEEFRGGITQGEGAAERALRGDLGFAQLDQDQQAQLLNFLLGSTSQAQRGQIAGLDRASRERISADQTRSRDLASLRQLRSRRTNEDDFDFLNPINKILDTTANIRGRKKSGGVLF